MVLWSRVNWLSSAKNILGRDPGQLGSHIFQLAFTKF